jgi:hypothetical protein
MTDEWMIERLDDYIRDFRKRTDGNYCNEGKNKLKEDIDLIYLEEKEIYKQSILETDISSEKGLASEKFFPAYNRIRELRKKYIMNLDNEVFDFPDLNLNSYEKEKLEEIVPKLVSDFGDYMNCLRCIRTGKTSLVYEDHNKNLYKRKYGIDPNISREEWESKTYKIWEASFVIPTKKKYEEMLTEFNSIVGLNPEGIITGFNTPGPIEDREDASEVKEEFAWNLNSNKCQDSYLNTVLKNLITDYKQTTNVTSIDSRHLYRTIRGMRVEADLNKFNKYENERISKEIDNLRGELNLIESKKSFKEIIYESSLNRESDHKKEVSIHRPMNVTKGRRIEDEYTTVKRRRRNSKREFYSAADKYLIPLKNRFSELEIEEAVVESNHMVDEFLGRGLTLDIMTDKVKRINYREKLKAEVDFELKGHEREVKFNKFSVDNNSNSNKKYDVVNISTYLKILVTLRRLKLNTKKEIYSHFGLKKCQSTYLIEGIVNIVKRSVSNLSYGFKSI